jgi:hypothetical protein
LKVFHNKVLSGIKREEEAEANFVTEIFLNCAIFEIFGRVRIWIVGGYNVPDGTVS